MVDRQGKSACGVPSDCSQFRPPSAIDTHVFSFLQELWKCIDRGVRGSHQAPRGRKAGVVELQDLAKDRLALPAALQRRLTFSQTDRRHVGGHEAPSWSPVLGAAIDAATPRDVRAKALEMLRKFAFGVVWNHIARPHSRRGADGLRILDGEDPSLAASLSVNAPALPNEAHSCPRRPSASEVVKGRISGTLPFQFQCLIGMVFMKAKVSSND
jgi:hypothetical protein